MFFALAWGGPLWLVAELINVKEPQWVMPAIPAAAMLAGAAIEAGKAKIGGRISWFYSLGPLLWPPLVALIVPGIFFAIEGRFPSPLRRRSRSRRSSARSPGSGCTAACRSRRR